jgi:hypothetical protein
VPIHDLDPVEEAEGRRAPELVGGIAQPLEAELHGLGVEIFAVVKFHSPAQLDLPGRGRHQLRELGGELRHQGQALIPRHQHVEHLGAHIGGRLLRLIHHVQRGRIHTLGDDHLARRGRDGGRGDQQGEGEDGQEENESTAPLIRVRHRWASFRPPPPYHRGP